MGIHHLDVKSSFLNGEIQVEVYVLQPEGYEKESQENKVYKLLKALYKLRQTPRAWYVRLRKFLERIILTKYPHEHAVYTKREGIQSLIICVYVDDLLLTGTSFVNIMNFNSR